MPSGHPTKTNRAVSRDRLIGGNNVVVNFSTALCIYFFCMGNSKVMKKRLGFAFLMLLVTVCAVFAQQQATLKGNMTPAETARIVKAFTTNEGNFREALTSYAFNRSATIHTIGLGGNITGTYRRDSYMTLTQSGERFEKIVFFPMPSTEPGLVTPEDLEDMGGVNPFALEPSSIDKYNFSYIGNEKIDALNLYVFEVTPKVIPDPKKTKLRLFTGRVWVDMDDLLIVKSRGKGVPETKVNKFPIFETWRENVDGKYWFPSYSASDDELVFDNGAVLKLKIRIKFTNYRLGRSEVRILDDDPTPKPTPSPTPIKP